MVKKASILFYPNVAKARINGTIPIYVRVILDREKFELSTGEYIRKLEEWNSEMQRINRRTPSNQVLSELEMKIQEAYQFLKFNGRALTVAAIKAQLKKGETSRVRLIDFLEDYFVEKVQANTEYCGTTKKTYRSAINHVADYLNNSGQNKLRLQEVDIAFVRNWDKYLTDPKLTWKKPLNRNSAGKYHTKFKCMLSHAHHQQLLEIHPYREFKIKSQQGRLTYLTLEELEELQLHSLGNNRSLLRVRDVFLFSVYTGLRFSDAINLTEENIVAENGEWWIEYRQQKTGNANRIPFLNKAKEIYKKYESERAVTGYVLPRITNQKLNVYLKVIAEAVGIDKPLSHHVARHTAATTILLQNGIPIEETSKFLGHRDIRTTQVYAKVTNVMLKNAAHKLNKIL